MIPPQAPQTGPSATRDAPAAVLAHEIATLTKRADFQRAARAAHAAMPSFILQARKRAQGEALGIRVGFTCSKKVGNAVARNRAKRRLREVARLALPRIGKPGIDYVLIGRKDATATLPFAKLQQDFEAALKRLHGTLK